MSFGPGPRPSARLARASGCFALHPAQRPAERGRRRRWRRLRPHHVRLLRETDRRAGHAAPTLSSKAATLTRLPADLGSSARPRGTRAARARARPRRSAKAWRTLRARRSPAESARLRLESRRDRPPRASRSRLFNLAFGELVPRAYGGREPAFRPYPVCVVWSRARPPPCSRCPRERLVAAHEPALAARFGAGERGCARRGDQDPRRERRGDGADREATSASLIHSVFEFADTVAREIMTPRVDLDSMPVRSELRRRGPRDRGDGP